MVDPATLPRGIRNNNPGNIRRDKTLWQGEASSQTDADFLVFSEALYGLRAIAVILLHYQLLHLATVCQMVSRWAPPGENDTLAYITAVANEIGVDAHEPLDLRAHPAQLAFFVEAIVRHENGQQPYPQDLIARACALAA